MGIEISPGVMGIEISLGVMGIEISMYAGHTKLVSSGYNALIVGTMG